ncbi:MAG TPA: phage tail tube protein, partial [Ilumatobacter sp.]|nr:phage tail tube protein [Ilumatobacter sp.]
QLGVADESTFNTPVTPSRFFEYNGNPAAVRGVAARTEGNPLRAGTRARRSDRSVPYLSHAEGTLEFDVMTKGVGYWFKHMLGTVATTGAGPYTHTATEGATSALVGKSFTAQMNYPFHPAGTNQSMTFSGGKVPSWSLTNDVEGMLTMSLNVWFASMTTGTALATPSYPASMENFSWAGGVITIGGSAIDVTNINVEVDNTQKVDSKAIRGNTASKEPTPGPLSITWGVECDFDSLTQWNRVHGTTRAATIASVVGTWTNGADTFTVTLPSARFDDHNFSGEAGSLGQSITGVGEDDGTASAPIELKLVSTDVTP